MREAHDLAAQVTDPAALEVIAGRYREGGGPAEVAGDAFTAPFSVPSAGLVAAGGFEPPTTRL